MGYLMSLIELKKPNKASLLPEFEAFILNDGYSSRIIKGSVCIAQYKHPSKPMLQFENTGKMNKAMKEKYKLFLNMYFQKGVNFIEQLRSQLKKVA